VRQFATNVVEFLKGEDGPTAVEYSVMVAMIIVICLGAIKALGNNANIRFQIGQNAPSTGS
jgi:pilus assembly protein Flp/PilA